MSVYVELVFFNNICVDALLVALTLIFRKRKILKPRFLLAVLFASGVATAYPILSDGWQIAIKVLLCPLVALVFDAYQKTSFKRWIADYLKSLATFALLTYFAGGIVYAISFALGVDVNSYLTLGIVALSLTIVCIVVNWLCRTQSKRGKRICKAKINCNKSEVELNCFCDSGNTLTDDLSGAPIVILSADAERQIVDNSAFSVEGYVNVKTVSSECSMPIVKLDAVTVDGREFVAYGALSRKQFDGFDVILQNTMF